MTPPQPSEPSSSFPQALSLRHSRMPLAGIHVDLGFRVAAVQGQDGFPITPLGNDVQCSLWEVAALLGDNASQLKLTGITGVARHS